MYNYNKEIIFISLGIRSSESMSGGDKAFIENLRIMNNEDFVNFDFSIFQ